MKSQLMRAGVIGAIVGFLGFGGVSLAQAQTSPSTTPKATQPATPPADGMANPNCPNMGGSGSSHTSPSGSASNSSL